MPPRRRTFRRRRTACRGGRPAKRLRRRPRAADGARVGRGDVTPGRASGTGRLSTRALGVVEGTQFVAEVLGKARQRGALWVWGAAAGTVRRLQTTLCCLAGRRSRAPGLGWGGGAVRCLGHWGVGPRFWPLTDIAEAATKRRTCGKRRVCGAARRIQAPGGGMAQVSTAHGGNAIWYVPRRQNARRGGGASPPPPCSRYGANQSREREANGKTCDHTVMRATCVCFIGSACCGEIYPV